MLDSVDEIDYFTVEYVDETVDSRPPIVDYDSIIWDENYRFTRAQYEQAMNPIDLTDDDFVGDRLLMDSDRSYSVGYNFPADNSSPVSDPSVKTPSTSSMGQTTSSVGQILGSVDFSERSPAILWSLDHGSMLDSVDEID
jgi:hypothetical protein